MVCVDVLGVLSADGVSSLPLSFVCGVPICDDDDDDDVFCMFCFPAFRIIAAMFRVIDRLDGMYCWLVRKFNASSDELVVVSELMYSCEWVRECFDLFSFVRIMF